MRVRYRFLLRAVFLRDIRFAFAFLISFRLNALVDELVCLELQ